MLRSAGQVPGVTVSAKLTATLVPHTSMALAVPREATLVESRQPSTASDGQTMLGASLSRTSSWVQGAVAAVVGGRPDPLDAASAGQVPGVTVSAKLTATLVSHTSMALAVPREATSPSSRQAAEHRVGRADDAGRVWTATDDCGNRATCTQTIEVIDSDAPSIVCPSDAVLGCLDSTNVASVGSASVHGRVRHRRRGHLRRHGHPRHLPGRTQHRAVWTATGDCVR